MSTFLVHPSLLSAYAAAVVEDPDLRRGTHLRLFPSAQLGFPLAPFAIWEVPAERVRSLPLAWFDPQGQPLATLDLDATREALGWITGPLPGEARLIGIEAQFHAGPGEVAILDRIVPDATGEHRIIAARSAPRCQAGAPLVSRLRLRGRGPVTINGWAVAPDVVFERLIGSAPAVTLGLPLDGDAPWYAGSEGRDVAWQRVVGGAPRRWTRPDRPDGPFAPLDRAAEEARVARFQPELDARTVRLVQDPATPPGAVVEVHESPATIVNGVRRPWQKATLEIQNALLFQALDTGVGRYLGLMTTLPPSPVEGEPFAETTAWVAAGVFAMRRGRLAPPDTREMRLIERLRGLFPGLERMFDVAHAGHEGGFWIDRTGHSREKYALEIRAFVAAALAAPPPDLLGRPRVRLGPAQWLREEDGPSTRFRQQFLVVSPPLAALAALGRLEADGWTSRHEMLELAPGSDPPVRAATRMFGRRESLTDGTTGLIDDSHVPAAGAPWTYRLALSDVFGRFGEAADVAVPLPLRPAVPAPVLQADVQLASPAAHSGLATAGTVTCRIPVPAVGELTAGSRPLARVVVTFASAQKDVPTPQAGGVLQIEFALPALMPMETRRLVARAHFEDVEGRTGAEATVAADVADPRAPVIPPTGIGIVWTSRPGPSEDVEFRLAFRGQSGARYRAYLTDERGLEIPTVVAGPEGERPRLRAEIAVDGAAQGLAGIGKRDRFRLVSEPPLEPRPDGTVSLDARLPRTLQTVQFLRLVPLSARGAEAPFEKCPLLPIAVPSDRRPPAPRLETGVGAGTGAARIRIVAEGLDLVRLKAAEPGLFGEEPLGAARPPAFRLRRASGVVPDPIYAREVARGTLARNGDAFLGEVDDLPGPAGLLPYVRYFYWAEVQMPPERRMPPGVTEIPLPAGAVLPTEPRQREDAPGLFSLASPPALVVRVPPDPPALAPESIAASVRSGAAGTTYILEVRVQNGPVVHPSVTGGFKVRLQVQEGEGDFTAATETPLAEGALSWSTERPAAVVPDVRVALLLVDPIGREGAPVFVEAVAQ